MDYNNKLEPIRMPEYGRHVQRMVDFALGIEDRTRRNQVAHSIVQTMRGLAPSMADGVSDHVYWDHLAMISNFTLDVDYPEGTIIEDMIKRACEMPMGAERAALEYFIAVQMKRGYMTWNSEVVDDLKIFKDLYELSQGEIMLTPENCKIVLNPNSIDKGGKQKVVKKSTTKFQARPVVKNKRK